MSWSNSTTESVHRQALETVVMGGSYKLIELANHEELWRGKPWTNLDHNWFTVHAQTILNSVGVATTKQMTWTDHLLAMEAVVGPVQPCSSALTRPVLKGTVSSGALMCPLGLWFGKALLEAAWPPHCCKYQSHLKLEAFFPVYTSIYINSKVSHHSRNSPHYCSQIPASFSVVPTAETPPTHGKHVSWSLSTFLVVPS